MRRSALTCERALLVLPAALVLAVVVLVPIVRVVALSFTRTEMETGLVSRWAGLESHARLWHDSRFFVALGNTFVFTGASVAVETLLGIAIALLLHARFRGRGIVRAMVMLPWALPTAIMALAWAWIFNDAYGVANDLLRRLGLIATPVAWLGERGAAMASLVIAEAWKTTPFVALIVLAGLQGIPQEVIEAARVDGLSAAQRLRHVVLPLIAPSILVAVLFRAIQAYGAFDIVYVMTGGGPGGSTETVSLYAYRNYFRYLDFGYGSAVASQSVLLGAALALVVVRLARPRSEVRA
jgi:multiple sugar transport system permease protein